MQADAEQAYTQADMRGNETWIDVPKHLYQSHWDPNERYVMRMDKALYGHPAAGSYWESHCHERVLQCGFTPIGECSEWNSCYMHADGTFLLIYVDDFKMAGPAKRLAHHWEALGELVKLGANGPVGQFLGCKHTAVTVEVGDGQNVADLIAKHCPGNAAAVKKGTAASGSTAPARHDVISEGSGPKHTVKVMEYCMEGFLDQCLEVYKQLAGKEFPLKHVKTPFIDEDDRENPTRSPQQSATGGLVCPWCVGCFPTEAFHPVRNSAEAAQVSKRVREGIALAGGGIQETEGEAAAPWLDTIAAKVVMKVFYAARVARPDLLRAIGHLSCYLTRWTPECDRRLHRLMCYVYSTKGLKTYGWVGDDIGDLRLHLYTDADFAGCQTTNKSTTGSYLSIEGPNTHFTISTISKKQGCVSYSTPEAEIIAGSFGHRQVGIPGMVMWERLSGQTCGTRGGGGNATAADAGDVRGAGGARGDDGTAIVAASKLKNKNNKKQPQ